MPSISSASRSEESGDCSGGFITTVLPAASGAADLPVQNMNGWLNGTMRADHAARLAHREVDHVRAHRDRRALHLGDEAGVELDLRGADHRVADHLVRRVAAVGRIDHRQLLAVLAHDLGDAPSIRARSSGSTLRHSANAAFAAATAASTSAAPASATGPTIPGAGIDVSAWRPDFGLCHLPP